MTKNKKADNFFADLFGYYWTTHDLARMSKDMGPEAFEMVNLDKEAALRFVTENLDDCIRIFNHRSYPRSK